MSPGDDIRSAIDSARPGEAICLKPGQYEGPLLIADRVTLWGGRDAIIRSSGLENTITMTGGGPALLGLTVQGSGSRFDKQDSAIHVVADDARVEGVRITGALFGIVVDKSRRVTLRGNTIRGTDEEQIGLRGDTIRLWETSDSLVENNVVTHGRDVVVWYSSRNTFRKNVIENSRYGTHFMFSHDNLCEENRYVGNVVGVFVMYSKGVSLLRNVLAASTGAAGMGLGLKEASALVARENHIIRNDTGVYIDTSPFEPGTVDVFEDNTIQLCRTAILFHAATTGNRFSSNLLRGNGEQVRVDGGGDAAGSEWHGNDFDDYRGYDLDGDGYGDIPHVQRRLSAELRATYPELDFFSGSPAMFLVNAMAEILPLYAPRTILTDARPRMSARAPGETHAD
ncbi:MAG: nitrous oxide reductase family maturation protein NosD [Deltaproteobacteria bacterium]|nr:nitrous oxide reductase family maturation protein NosD [Deltaproteobacteria bacterium]